MNEIKELKDLETTKKGIRKIRIRKNKLKNSYKNEILLSYFLRYVCQLVNQTKEKKGI